MSRLGKSFKNRFLRRALAMVLAGTMVMSGMPVSFAAETSDAETAVEAEVQGGTEEATEEAAEEHEVAQKESEETESGKTSEAASETASKEETTVAESKKETEATITEASKTTTVTETEVSETEVTETDTEETETEETTEEEENEYSQTDAILADGHTYAEWDINGTIVSDKNNVLNSSKGTYTNSARDVLYIDATSGKFDPTIDTDKDNVADRIQINASTKIYIPVKVDDNSEAKIAIYQSNVTEKQKLTESNFVVSGDDLTNAECTAFEPGGSVAGKSYYKIEWTCTLKNSTNPAPVCIEVKDEKNYAIKITSGEKVRTDLYDDTTGDDASLVQYKMEGYANSYGVTGGGVMQTNAANYHTVSTAEEFLQALLDIQKASEPAVIRITENLNLGSKEIKNFKNYAAVITADPFQALWHPVLKRTGVSDLALNGFKDLTIFSTNGAAIKHCDIIITNSENIIFRNLVFDELWEWDDGGTYDAPKGKTTYDRGGYDRNDWDYIGIETNSDGIWIDHCTFYKAYDGVIDVKKAKGKGEDQRVTISWCKFEPKSASKVVDGETTYPFYDAQIEYLEKHKSETTYYKQLRNPTTESFDITYDKYNKEGELIQSNVTETLKGANYSKEDVITYTCGQKKTHLLGQDDKDETAKGIRVTFAYNSYKNSMDRMPRLRFGIAHEYNCILDADELYYAHYVAADGSKFDKHLVSNGALSNKEGYVFLENCYIDGIKNPLVSGNDQSSPGFIGASDTIYMIYEKKDDGTWEKVDKSSELKPENNNSPKVEPWKVTLDEFQKKLPENYGDYKPYAASELKEKVLPYAGAGVLKMNPIRWTKTSYGDGNTTDTTDLMTWDASTDQDPAENDHPNYSIEDGSGEEGGDDDPSNPTEPTEPDKYEDFSLDAKDIPKGDIESEYDSEIGFIIKAGTKADSKHVTVEEKTNELDGKKFTKRIKLNGSAKTDCRTIYFETKGEGTLTVYAESATSGTGRTLEIYTYTASTDKLTVVPGLSEEGVDGIKKLTYKISEAGSYYIGSKSSGMNIYYIAFAYKSNEGNEPPETDPTPPETDPTPSETDPDNEDKDTISSDSLYLSANELKATEIKTSADKGQCYTIIGTNDAPVTIEALENSVPINDKPFTKVIKLGGVGSPSSRAIAIKDIPAAKKLIVYARSSGTGKLALSTESGTPGDENIKSVTANAEQLEYEISEAGTYYLYASEGSIDIFYVEYVDSTAGGNGDNEGDENKTDTFYDETDGNSAELTKYNLEGFAASAKVTGGGLLKEGSKNYYKVTNEKEFIDALYSVRDLGTNGGLKPAAEIKPAVIEIVNDLNLGCLELEKQGINIAENPAKTVMEKTKNTKQPLMHPTLKETGVSFIRLNYFHNLTIYSKTGASIKHCGIRFEGATSNIIIRNITFDEFWEWDEKTSGKYDENDWDYMTVGEQTDGLWIDHCTFYKAYDGILDIKGDSKQEINRQRVTISWCEFLPGSKDNTFFNAQMDDLEANKSSRTYYKQLRDGGMSKEDVWWYAYGQKKTHLFGADDGDKYASMIRATLANNYYKNSMDRMPRLRFGKVHEYNCILDAQELYTQKTSGNSGLSSHITSNGAISTCDGEMLLENCYISGILNPLNSGNAESPTGYINAVDSLYYLNNVETTLAPKKNGTGSGDLLITDAEAFVKAIPYKNYVKYDASSLDTNVKPFVGAGTIKNWSTVQWEKVSYGARATDVTEDYTEGQYGGDKTATSEPIEVPKANPDSTGVKSGTVIELKVEDSTIENIYYTTDGSDPREPGDARKTYDKEAGIVITEAVTIKAAAQKGDKYSEVATFTYTILSGEEVPVAAPNADWPTETEFPSTGGSVTLTAGEGAAIYYLMDNKAITETPGASSKLYDGPIAITEQTYIRAVAIKDGMTSTVLDLHYTVVPAGEVVKPSARPASGAVAKGTKIELFTTEAVDNIYYRTDGLDPKTDGRKTYDKAAGIIVNEEVTIRAVAEKDGKYSQDVSFTYTILSETPVDPPVNPVDPTEPEDPVVVKTIKLSECEITVPSIIYNSKAGAKQPSTTYVTYKYTDGSGNEKHVKFAEDLDYSVVWNGKGEDGNYSVTLTGLGRPKDGRSVDGYIIDPESLVTKTYKVIQASANGSGNVVDVSKAKIDFKAAVKTRLKTACYTGYAYEIGVDDLDFSKDTSKLKSVPMENIRVVCNNNINAGKATVTISVNPDEESATYVGVKTLNFTIKKATLNKDNSKATATVNFDRAASAAQQYMGASVEAVGLEVTAKNGVALRKNEDYTVTYKNSVKDGKVNVAVTVKGVGNNLSGSWSGTFAINQLNLSDASLEFGTKDGIPYSPKGAKLGTITVTKDGNTCTLREGVDFTAKYVYDQAKKYNVGGKVKATITGKGACKGTKTFADLVIIQADFDSDAHIIVSADVTVDKDELAKNRTKAFEKAVTVTDASGVKLKANKDYKITPASDAKTLTIAPMGTNAQNYTGTKTVSYRVATNLAKDKNFVFNKNKEKAKPLAYDGRNPVRLTAPIIKEYVGNQYELGVNIEIVPGTYKNNAKKGTAQVTVRGIAGVDGGFYGTKVLKFKIVEK